MKYRQQNYTCVSPNRFQSSLEKWLIKVSANRSQVALEVGTIPVFTALLTMHRNGKIPDEQLVTHIPMGCHFRQNHFVVVIRHSYAIINHLVWLVGTNFFYY